MKTICSFISLVIFGTAIYLIGTSLANSKTTYAQFCVGDYCLIATGSPKSSEKTFFNSRPSVEELKAEQAKWDAVDPTENGKLKFTLFLIAGAVVTFFGCRAIVNKGRES